MPELDYSITFACYNQVEYTKKCIDSIVATGGALERVVVVDNGSSDETRHYLQGIPLGAKILNRDNLGCGVAWNQGILARQSEWTAIMNNDVIVSPLWIERLIGRAKQLGLLMISPALIEGDLDYDFSRFTLDLDQQVATTDRLDTQHAVCLVVHHSVFQNIGYFRPEPKLLGFEDAIFFHAAKKAQIHCAISGAAWLHHFGSITQTLMKQERGLKQSEDLVKHNDRKLLNQTWLSRKWSKIQRHNREKAWRDAELAAFGLTLHGHRRNGQFQWT